MNLYVILGLVFSGFVNVLFFVALLFEPYRSIASHAWRRAWRSKDNKINCLFYGKNGNIKETLCDIGADGTVEYNEDKYVLNPKLQFNHHGVQTQLYVEGETEPLNPFEDEEAQRMTTRELSTVMIGGHIDDFLELLKQYKPIVITAVIIFAGFVLVDGYLTFQLHQEVVQGATGTVQPN